MESGACDVVACPPLAPSVKGLGAVKSGVGAVGNSGASEKRLKVHGSIRCNRICEDALGSVKSSHYRLTPMLKGQCYERE